ncbi:DM13 domain-containing protein [Couchioplanes caeruleus]|uniref:DM13 domain-containing protein n=1 Tax=Couchioplanes caeruleus TaxID=56438 RepID=UPI0020C03F5F|nr:DM13 domain-containing protein [Couchioplanes caeruleus]UQU62323.1 DM13 domain-containing protein [Couchioplanes caeruleus]
MIRRLLHRPTTWLVIAVLGAGAVAGLFWFQPWRLVTDTTVADQLSTADAPTPAPAASSPSGSSAAAPPAGPVVVRKGTFVSHEHDTTGAARLVRNGDGTHQLELVGLDTSDGPDLRVWLTDQQAITGPDAWSVFDDGRHVELGRLKGNRGNQVYPVPADVKLDNYRSISIWCKRFSVSFGAALLQ